VDYYRDYGETLVATYCHDLTKDYENVGIEQLKNKNYEFRVYPNPTSGELFISGTGYGVRGTDIEIFDVFGRNVVGANCIRTDIKTDGRPENNEMVIDISHLPNGIYFIQIQTETDKIVKKIIKK
jgi:hypothetical protein